MDLKEKSITKGQAIDLILQDPNLLRRPLVVKGKTAVFGWKPEEYEQII